MIFGELSAMNDIQADLIGYLELLKSDFGLSITLHPTDSILAAGFGSLFRYNFHTSPLCILCKQNPAAHLRCVRNQKLIRSKCRGGQPSFYGLCHAGMGGFVFPVFSDSLFIGYICFNGYKSEIGELNKRLNRLHGLTGIGIDELRKRYEASARDNDIDASKLAVLAAPIVHMLRELYAEIENGIKNELGTARQNLNLQLISYIYQNSAEDISIASVASHFHFSRSYISHMFKKSNSVSFSDFLCRVRLENAAGLLVSTRLPISGVASEVGFDDANYFSKVFHQKYNASPSEYRRMNSQPRSGV